MLEEFTEANFRNIESKSEARDGTIYLMDNEHTLLSIDPFTGRVNWKFKHRSNYPRGTASTIYSIPREVPDGTIYLGSHDKTFMPYLLMERRNGNSEQKNGLTVLPHFLQMAPLFIWEAWTVSLESTASEILKRDKPYRDDFPRKSSTENVSPER